MTRSVCWKKNISKKEDTESIQKRSFNQNDLVTSGSKRKREEVYDHHYLVPSPRQNYESDTEASGTFNSPRNRGYSQDLAPPNTIPVNYSVNQQEPKRVGLVGADRVAGTNRPDSGNLLYLDGTSVNQVRRSNEGYTDRFSPRQVPFLMPSQGNELYREELKSPTIAESPMSVQNPTASPKSNEKIQEQKEEKKRKQMCCLPRKSPKKTFTHIGIGTSDLDELEHIKEDLEMKVSPVHEQDPPETVVESLPESERRLSSPGQLLSNHESSPVKEHVSRMSDCSDNVKHKIENLELCLQEAGILPSDYEVYFRKLAGYSLSSIRLSRPESEQQEITGPRVSFSESLSLSPILPTATRLDVTGDSKRRPEKKTLVPQASLFPMTSTDSYQSSYSLTPNVKNSLHVRMQPQKPLKPTIKPTVATRRLHGTPGHLATPQQDRPSRITKSTDSKPSKSVSLSPVISTSINSPRPQATQTGRRALQPATKTRDSVCSCGPPKIEVTLSVNSNSTDNAKPSYNNEFRGSCEKLQTCSPTPLITCLHRVPGSSHLAPCVNRNTSLYNSQLSLPIQNSELNRPYRHYLSILKRSYPLCSNMDSWKYRSDLAPRNVILCHSHSPPRGRLRFAETVEHC